MTILEQQFPYIDRVLAAWRISSLRVEGYEADDIIGTLSKDLYNRFPDAQIYCVTGDKDMYQLVNDRVFVLNPMKDLLAKRKPSYDRNWAAHQDTGDRNWSAARQDMTPKKSEPKKKQDEHDRGDN